MGKESREFGLFIALFFSLYKVSERVLRRVRKTDDGWNNFIAGMVAGLSLLAESSGNRMGWAQYLFIRALHCSYNHFHTKLPLLQKLKHGNSILFVLSCAQIVYGFALRPDSLPPEYAKFLGRLVHLPPMIIENVRKTVRNQPIDYEALVDYNKRNNGNGDPFNGFTLYPNVIPCSIIHPSSDCNERAFNLFSKSFKVSAAMYLSFYLIPLLLFKNKEFLKKPKFHLTNAVINTARSSSFLSTFCLIAQWMLCGERKLISRRILEKESKYIFWFIGLIGSLTIFIEKFPRRTELALYVCHSINFR